MMIRKRFPLNDHWWFAAEFNEAMRLGEIKETWQQVRLPHSVVETPYNYFSEARYQGIWGYGRTIKWSPAAFDIGEDCLESNEWDWILRFEGAAHSAKVYVDGQPIGQHIGGYAAFEFSLPEGVMNGEPHWLSVELDSREQLNCPPFGHVIDYLTYGGLYREVAIERRPKSRITEYYAYGRDLLTANPKLVFEIRQQQEAYIQSGAEGLHISGDELRFELIALPLATDLDGWLAQSKESEDPKEAKEGAEQWTVVLDETVPWTQGGGPLHGSPIRGPQQITLSLPGSKGELWQLWDVDAPYRYRLKVTCIQTNAAGDTIVVDQIVVDLGLREAQFTEEGFFLNGKKTKLTGINRHQSYAYVGYAMPRGPQWQDAHIIKQQLGMNAVRTAHYPQSHHFMEACDVLGILVFTEIPGWQHIGDQEWQKHALAMAEEMVLDYRQHPSIILWGVRINESLDNEQLYRATNDLARKHDPLRQTGGARYLRNSQLLEDVYAFNDFTYNGVAKGQKGILPRGKVTGEKVTAKNHAGYLVSEYNGHMFPTKSFDPVSHRAEHARRHAHVLSAIGGEKGVAGGFAWCLFDYNTHKDFGSGDGICHHGVLDLFRNEKLAAAVYSSQKPIEEGLVLAVDSEVHIGDYPGGAMGPITVYTNAESLRLYQNGTLVGQYKRDAKALQKYRGLKHPPIVLDDLVGNALAVGEGYSDQKAERIKRLLLAGAKFGTDHLPFWAWILAARLVLFEGFRPSDGLRLFSKYIGNWGDAMTQYTFLAMQGETEMGRIELGAGGEPRLQVTVDRPRLIEGETYDVACVRFKSVDAGGMGLPYDQGVVSMSVEGPIEIIGPSVVALQGGMGGTYIKTIRQEKSNGTKGQLRIQRQGSAQQIIEFIIGNESEEVF
jgi:beta-galactosidase